jgi:hypothetical protein
VASRKVEREVVAPQSCEESRLKEVLERTLNEFDPTGGTGRRGE